MFVALGAKLIQADQISHELMQPGQTVYEEVVHKFGSGILNPDGTVNRPRLAEAAFGRPEELTPSRVAELNQIVQAALILEAGAAKRFDRLIVVTCTEEQRVQRFAARLRVDLAPARREVTRRMAAQLPDEEKVKAADFVIDNSGSLDST